MVDWPGSNHTSTLRWGSGERNWFGTFGLPFQSCTDRLILLPFLGIGNLLFNRWNGSGCIYTTHTSIACPVTRLFVLFLFCVNDAGSHAWLYFFFPFCLSHFLYVHLFVHKLHSACLIRFYPRCCYFSSAAELTIYRSSIFPLFFLGGGDVIKQGTRKERESRRYSKASSTLSSAPACLILLCRHRKSHAERCLLCAH